nr:flavin reductase (NADPH)-like isoform X2 [Cherax quadricarinatus]
MYGINKLVIFGASGNTGVCCVQAALNMGYEVTAFVRNPAKLPGVLASQVRVEVGDVLDESAVAQAVQGQDAVVILLGTRNNLSPTTMMSEGTKNIIDAMSRYGVRRVSACLSAFNFRERSEVPERYLPLLDDHERMLEALKSSNLEWIAVLPSHLTDEPGNGDYVKEYGYSPGGMVSKYNLADFMVSCLSDDSNLYQLCGISDKAEI